jgi:hypothetical protein
MSGAAVERALEARRVVSIAGDLLAIEGAQPLPIGTRVWLAPASLGLTEPGAEPVRGKITQIRRAADGWIVTIRLHCLTRTQRAALAELASRAKTD